MVAVAKRTEIPKGYLFDPSGNQSTTSMAFLADLELYLHEKPYRLSLPSDLINSTPGAFHSNAVHDVYSNIVVTNVRGSEDTLALDRNGFKLFTHETGLAPEEFEDRATVRSRYFAEMETWLKKALGAKRVVIFDVATRQRGHKFEEGGEPNRQPDGKQQPLCAVHVDQTKTCVEKWIHHLFPDEAEELLQSRYQVVTAWRPLVSPSLQDWPLALCDPTSVTPEEDLVATDRVLPHFLAENYNLYYNPKYRFYFADKQTIDEVWVFKQYDSSAMHGPQFVPHVSFKYQHAAPNATPRQSVDVMAMVLY